LRIFCPTKCHQNTEKRPEKKIHTGVGHRNVPDFIGIKPDLLLATAEDAGSKSLLQPQAHHSKGKREKEKREG
jgi:hypothetical protein